MIPLVDDQRHAGKPSREENTMVLEATFIRDHDALTEMVQKLFINSSCRLSSIDLFGTGDSVSGVECRCWVYLVTAQGDQAKVELSHADLVEVVRSHLKAGGYGNETFQLRLSAFNEDENGLLRRVVCFINLELTVNEALPDENLPC